MTQTPRSVLKQLLVVAVLAVAALLLSSCSAAGSGSGGGSGAAAALTDADLVIPVAEVTDQASFYPLNVGGEDMEVLAVKASDGTIRTAFNTCQVCYDSGKGYYKWENGLLVCQNCGNQFGPDQVEVEVGGCNPVPIFDEAKTVDATTITIPLSYLQQQQALFANWAK
jgi:uncharacterized membrane protein